ncbi:ParB/RepB/Spo0J family partition protein [Actinomadura sp. LOL_016]|uniref:ParB/RepB/Spo0J family partition protein n=1 Tax=unclassified Actinomadura TaxID=2626254 RepID=UPI003A804A44
MERDTEPPREAPPKNTGKTETESNSPSLPPVNTVPVDELLPGISPRRAEDPEHIHRLAQTDAKLPPILVHYPSMRVIDGMHRLKAALLQGKREIDVIFFDGSDDSAFLRAVQENIAHGLPLSLAERKAAALRIIDTWADLSDRAIAANTGLSTRTVAQLRKRSTDESPHLNKRRGLDGRMRPLDHHEGRRRAAEAMTRWPEASLREIAKIADVSLGTAHDVRRRLHRGEDPVPSGARPAVPSGTRPAVPPVRTARGDGDLRTPPAEDPILMLQKLARDPALRQTEPGRQLLRLLHSRMATPRDWSALIVSVPPHCAETAAAVARHCARNWEQMAQLLERRAESPP